METIASSSESAAGAATWTIGAGAAAGSALFHWPARSPPSVAPLPLSTQLRQ